MARATLNAVVYEQVEDLPVEAEAGSLDRAPHQRALLLLDGAEIAGTIDSDELENEDLAFVEEQAGAILTELADGTYHVRWFRDEDDLANRWADLLDDLSYNNEE